MKARPFAIVSGVVTVAYSAICFLYFSEPFWGLTAICVGYLVTFYPLYFERQRIETIRHTQVAQYLHGVLPSGRSNSVYGRKLRDLHETLAAIERENLPLTPLELSAFVDQRLTEKLATAQTTRYWVTHLVDSEQSWGVWGCSHSTYPYQRSYADRQRTLLENGGEIVRLFLFERKWLTGNLQQCREMLDRHRALFSGTKKPIIILASVPHQGDGFVKDDLSLIDSEEAFLWTRSDEPHSTGYESGRYITNSNQVEALSSYWARISGNAYPPEEFFRLVEESQA
jgi:hypothetical protein